MHAAFTAHFLDSRACGCLCWHRRCKISSRVLLYGDSLPISCQRGAASTDMRVLSLARSWPTQTSEVRRFARVEAVLSLQRKEFLWRQFSESRRANSQSRAGVLYAMESLRCRNCSQWASWGTAACKGIRHDLVIVVMSFQLGSVLLRLTVCRFSISSVFFFWGGGGGASVVFIRSAKNYTTAPDAVSYLGLSSCFLFCWRPPIT